ncbi:MAG: glycosyltransferase family 4 protein [Gammaproteobacteria bacterium]|nr:glycosyltransferase family 4 protein [Gammaproteobacteria bacterium]
MTAPTQVRDGRVAVLLIDTLSATNDFGVELALALAQEVDLTVVTVAGTPLQSGPSMRVLPFLPRYGGGGRVAKALAAIAGSVRLASTLWRHRHGVVHVQFMRFPRVEWFIYHMFRPWLRCLVITVHNTLPHERRAWHHAFYGRWYRLADRLHVLSENVGRQLVEQFGLPADRLDMVPHGNYRRFVTRNSRPTRMAELGLDVLDDPARFVVGFFGLIRPYKGVLDLARAFALLDDLEVDLVIAGKVEQSARVEMGEVDALLGGHPRFHLLPRFLSESELAALLRRANLVVFPYTDISQSGALMLALSHDKVVIANDIAGFREYIVDGESGVLCRTDDVAEFARTLRAVIQDGALRERIACSVRILMAGRYGWDTIARGLLNCYQSGLQGVDAQRQS